MKGKRWWVLCGIFFLVFLATGFDGHFLTRAQVLKMHLRPQHRDFWCWAASTEMVSEYLGRRISQCDSVLFVTGFSYCDEGCNCENGWGSAYGATLEQMIANWEAWDFKCTHLAGPLAWRDLTKEISDGRRPIFALWDYEGGGGHVVVVNGYSQPAGSRIVPLNRCYVSYKDPWPPDCQPSDDWWTCTSVAGGDEAVCGIIAFVADGEHFWGDTLYHFIDTRP